MQAFANNPDVAFGDVNLAEDQVRSTPAGGDHNPGAGGWPTVKYFNKETGYAGRPYKQKTGDAMCDELGNDVYMQGHIEEAGNTHLCRVSDGAGCGEKVGFRVSVRVWVRVRVRVRAGVRQRRSLLTSSQMNLTR